MLELHKKRSSWNEFLKAQRWLLGRDTHFFITTSKFWLRLESFHQTILGWIFVKCSFFTWELFAITKESLFFREVLQTLNLWPKFGHPNHILRLEFAKTILILQISNLKFITLQSLTKKNPLNLGWKTWMLLGCNFKNDCHTWNPKPIAIFEISTLDFAKLQFHAKQKILNSWIWNRKCPTWVFLAWNLKQLLLHLK